jgi:hypothetical protein
MKRRLIEAAVLTFTVAGAAPAFAELDGPWGTMEEAKVCVQIDSAECKAEIERRATQGCLKDPRRIPHFVGKAYFPNDPVKAAALDKDNCIAAAKNVLEQQADQYATEQQAAEKKQAALDAAEVPVAKMHDAKLEKAVAVAYDKDYPGNKILKVVLDTWSDEYEKDAFGRVTGRDLGAVVVVKLTDGTCQLHDEFWLQHGNGRSFSGPLSARGAGSMQQTAILCTKAEAAASAPSAGKTKKKGK